MARRKVIRSEILNPIDMNARPDPFPHCPRATVVRLDDEGRHVQSRTEVMVMGQVHDVSSFPRHSAVKVIYLPLKNDILDNQASDVLWWDVESCRFEKKMAVKINQQVCQVTKMYLE